MDEKTMRLFHLDHCRGIGRRTINLLLAFDPDLGSIVHLTLKDLVESFQMPRKSALTFLHDFHSFNPQKTLASYTSKNISVISIYDPCYPPYLKNIYDPPLILYIKGDPHLFSNKKMLSVVGTRQPSAEAGRLMAVLLLPLIEDGWTIVSGMALGVDGLAHQLALKGHTIAVLGSGLFHPYPLQHAPLFQKLCRDQLVVSEYPPPVRPQKWQFPERNRIISGLSAGTLVIEAKERSGSLITADQALEQGREVMAVPGSPLNPNSRGTNRLIQQGARLVFSSEDILEELSNFT